MLKLGSFQAVSFFRINVETRNLQTGAQVGFARVSKMRCGQGKQKKAGRRSWILILRAEFRGASFSRAICLNSALKFQALAFPLPTEPSFARHSPALLPSYTKTCKRERGKKKKPIQKLNQVRGANCQSVCHGERRRAVLDRHFLMQWRILNCLLLFRPIKERPFN